jgi:hypothetical protein
MEHLSGVGREGVRVPLIEAKGSEGWTLGIWGEGGVSARREKEIREWSARGRGETKK